MRLETVRSQQMLTGLIDSGGAGCLLKDPWHAAIHMLFKPNMIRVAEEELSKHNDEEYIGPKTAVVLC